MVQSETRALEFGKLRQAIQFKLTDTALEALLEARKSGARMMLNVGSNNVRARRKSSQSSRKLLQILLVGSYISQ